MPAHELGPLEPLLQDEHVTEIMVNRFDEIYVERRGKLEKTYTRFDSEEQLQEIARKIVEPIGRRLNESEPIVDSRLSDGTLVNIVIPPIAIGGTTMTLRKFMHSTLTVEDIVRLGACSAQMMDFLKACVVANLNLVLAGGASSGKTTCFEILTGFIPEDERLILIEHNIELEMKNKHLIRLEARPANLEGRGEISVQQLVRNALKMRPERLIIGEVRGPEAIEVIQAMNTGHNGSMFTMHATNIRDAVLRLEAMMTMAGLEVPLLTLREQLGMALNVIVSQQRLRDGVRRITRIAEVTGTQGGAITTQDIFEFVETGMTNNQIHGYFTPTGYIPQFIQRLHQTGFTFDEQFFAPINGQ